MTTKSIGYAYPTSPQARQFRHRNGCYVVSRRQPAICAEQAIAAFDTLEKAEAYADTLPYAYDRYSMRADRRLEQWHVADTSIGGAA